MIEQCVKDSFNSDGMFVWPNFIAPERAQRLRDLVLDMAEFEKRGGADYVYPFDPSGLTQRVWNLTNKSREFRDILEIDELNDMMNFIFDRPTSHQLFHLSSFQANILNCGAPRQKLHIDTPFPEPIPPWPAKANSIWMLDDFTCENGATEFIRGSHIKETKPTKLDDQNCEVEIATGTRGSVLFTHGNLWHRAGANRSSAPRVGLLCSFAASYMKEIASEEDQSLIIQTNVIDQMSDRLRSIIGVGHGMKDGSLFQHESTQ